MTDKQTDILPANPLVGDNRKRVALLSQIYFEHKHGEPGAVLLRSVKRIGVLHPVVVFPVPGELGMFYCYDGGRRCKAAKAADRTEIPIRVIDPSDVLNDDGQVIKPEVLGDLVTLVSNNHRSINAVEELFAIERLMKTVGSLETVAKTLSIPLGTMRRRLRIARLIPPLRDAFNHDFIAVGVAEKVASLPESKQQDLLDLCLDEESGKFKVTAAHVRQMRQVQIEQIAAELPDSMFEGPTAEEATEQYVRVRRADLNLIMEQAIRRVEIDGAVDAYERVHQELNKKGVRA